MCRLYSDREIHAQPDARILQSSVRKVGNVDRVAKERFVHLHAHVIQQHEMKLVDVKRVQFIGTVFDDPAFHRAVLGNDVGNAGVGIDTRGFWPSTVR